MAPFEIRAVDRYPEPLFAQLQRVVFAGVQTVSPELAGVIAEEGQQPMAPTAIRPTVHRFGAYRSGELIGWSYGWIERGNMFYMANSGVAPEARRLGVYSALLEKIEEAAEALGVVLLRSQHSVLNNPIIIAKLKAGFHISGLHHSAQMGTLLEAVARNTASELGAAFVA